jgi:PAS domain S-box-containing protein
MHQTLSKFVELKKVMNVDTRKEIRVPLELPVTYRDFDNGTYHSLTKDLSTRGVCIESKRPLEVGTRCRMMFALPDDQKKTEITGKVCWQAIEQRTGRMGIQFSEPFYLSVPFAATEQALRRWRQQAEAYFDRVYERMSDACVWVNSKGEIIRHDERFLTMLGYSEEEVEGRPLCDFAYGKDRRRLALLMVPEKTGLSSFTSESFCMQPKEGSALLWKIGILSKPLWMASREVYIEEITEFRALKDEKHLNHFRRILGAAATGFLTKDIVNEVCDPFTCLVARLDLVHHRLALERKKSPRANGNELAYCAQEIRQAEGLLEELTKRFRYVVENTYSLEPGETTRFDINECLSIAISIIGVYEESDGEGIKFDPQAKLPKIESNKQEFLMIFLIFLLLSRDGLRTVSDKTIKCETKEDENHITVRISHNGYLHHGKYLDILFDNNPLETYFFKSHSTYFMDAILYYGNALLKKNNLTIKINNIPGQFSLSLFIPLEAQSSKLKAERVGKVLS